MRTAAIWFVVCFQIQKDIVQQLHRDFEKNVYVDQDSGVEFWLARPLQVLLGYAKWENFTNVIDKAKPSCKNAGFEPLDHFPDIRKKVELGMGKFREVDDIALTRYACYLIAQNGDPSRDPIALPFMSSLRLIDVIIQQHNKSCKL